MRPDRIPLLAVAAWLSGCACPCGQAPASTPRSAAGAQSSATSPTDAAHPTARLPFDACGRWSACVEIDTSSGALVGSTDVTICADAQFRLDRSGRSEIAIATHDGQRYATGPCEESLPTTFPPTMDCPPTLRIPPCPAGPVATGR